MSNELSHHAGAKYEEWAWKTARSLGSMSDDEYRKRYEAKWSDMP